jgi:hypothetical protein
MRSRSKSYCSDACMVEARKERRRLKGRTAEEYAAQLEERERDRQARKQATRERERQRRRERYRADPAIRERINRWNREHRDTRNQRARERHQKLREEVLAAYGGSICECCGETTVQFLAIDHIDGNGSAHRKQLREQGIGAGAGFYKWLRDNGFPSGFRVLCHNCNSAYGYYGYCPHQETVAENLTRRSE